MAPCSASGIDEMENRFPSRWCTLMAKLEYVLHWGERWMKTPLLALLSSAAVIAAMPAGTRRVATREAIAVFVPGADLG